MPGELTHFDSSGASRMVSVGKKEITERMARTQAFVSMEPATLKLIQDRQLAKGDVLEVARLAGIMATKQTQNLIPLCHSLGLDSASIDYEFVDDRRVRIEARVSNHGRTGVEMEAMTAVSIAALTIYDMCKGVDRWMSVGSIELLEKSGGKSGHLERSVE
jgi:cyclic pyranopterin phosphate synthase